MDGKDGQEPLANDNKDKGQLQWLWLLVLLPCLFFFCYAKWDRQGKENRNEISEAEVEGEGETDFVDGSSNAGTTATSIEMESSIMSVSGTGGEDAAGVSWPSQAIG